MVIREVLNRADILDSSGNVDQDVDNDLVDTRELFTNTTTQTQPERTYSLTPPIGSEGGGPHEWTRHPDNPLTELENDTWASNGQADPAAMVIDGTVWLLYEGREERTEGNRTVLSAASSETGMPGTFTVHPASPFHTAPTASNVTRDRVSWPMVFREGDTIYMTPAHGVKDLYLFKTTVSNFPAGPSGGDWEEVWAIHQGHQVLDTTIVRHDGLYYLIATMDSRDPLGATSHLPYLQVAVMDDLEDPNSYDLVGDITPTDPNSGGVGEKSAFVTKMGDDIYIHSQDRAVSPTKVRGFTLSNLSPQGFSVTRWSKNPVLTSGADGSWDDRNIHSLSIVYKNGKWLGYYDGDTSGTFYKIGVVEMEAKA